MKLKKQANFRYREIGTKDDAVKLCLNGCAYPLTVIPSHIPGTDDTYFILEQSYIDIETGMVHWKPIDVKY